MSADTPPLIFTRKLSMLAPVNPAARSAVAAIEGQVVVEIKRANRNQRRRSLYWVLAGLVTDILNDLHGLSLTEQDLHDITRDKVGLVEEITLPSGDKHYRRRSTSDRAMQEPERAEYTDKAFKLWSRWTGIDVDTLRNEAEAA